MVYQFGYMGSSITCLTQSPVIDVVAVGLLDGTVVIFNIKADEKIDSVRQDDRVTAITFRTGTRRIQKWKEVICFINAL